MKYLNIIVFILLFICIDAQGQNAPFRVNQVGHETPTKPSLKNRLDGCREITIVYPNRLRNQTDRYLFGNLVYYFQKLGLQTHTVEVPYEVKQPAQGVVQYFRKDGFEEYLNNTNQLIVLPQLVSGFPDIERFYIGVYDPVNDWAWEFNFEPKNKVDKYISQLASYITPQINYSPDKLMSFRPPFIVANWNNENAYRSAMASSGYDPYEGIYESENYRAYLKKHSDGNYYFVYIGGCSYDFWKNGGGAVKSLLRPTATPGIFKADWWDAYGVRDKHSWNAVFSPGLITFIDSDGDKTQFLKMYPTSSESVAGTSEGEEWSGSGFALKNGYIVTNFHVIDGASSIIVKGINGDFNISYPASVVGVDKNNDLALLKISDPNFKGFGNIPYFISSLSSEVGEEIFVLGYPLTSTMGDEIKLTTGVISSKSGFQGDVSLYQISAPIQPGNSGGPLFDKRGNIVGVVSAKHAGAENVGYAIKTSYLRNLIDSYSSQAILPTNNSISGLPLTGKVRQAKNFVFMISCSNKSSFNNNSVASSNIPSTSQNQVVVNNPSIASTTASRTRITKVTANEYETIIEFSGNNNSMTGYYSWVTISPQSYIMANGQKYTLTRAEGIGITPKKTYFNSPDTDYTFKLYFPAIPLNVSTFDFIESPESEWKFYGVRIR